MRSSEGRMTGLRRLRKKMIILDHYDISTDPPEFQMVVGEGCGGIVLLGTWQNPLVSFASAPPPPLLPTTKRH